MFFSFHCRSLLRPVSTNLMKSQRLASNASNAVGPVYELRIYSIKPDHFSTARQLLVDKFHTRFNYSKPMGFWITELGGIFQTVHIWPYESLGHRAAVRQALANDKEWQQGFLAGFLPCASVMDNSLLVLQSGTSLCTDFEPSPKATYELLSIQGGAVLSPAEPGQEITVGRFQTIFGLTSTDHYLFRYPDADTAFKQARSRQERSPLNGYSRFMLPHDCSPLK